MPVLTTTTLARRLREETRDAHQAAELAMGLPGTVTSRADYGLLLTRLTTVHRVVEREWHDPRWSDDWAGVGIDLPEHTRSHLLEDDLRTLGQPYLDAEAAPSRGSATSFAAVLGLLYVVEGSALGGMVLGPMIRSALGEVPTRFYDSDGRHHPRPWRSLQSALKRFDEDGGGDVDAVVHGARDAFDMFRGRLASDLWSAAR